MEKEKRKFKLNKKQVIVAISAVFVIMILIIVLVYNNYMKQKQAEKEQQEAEYRDKITQTIGYTLTNSYGCSSYVSAYLSAVQKYRLNKTLIESVLKANTEELRNTMKEYDKTIVENMQWLNSNKLEKYNEVYDILLEMYDNYRSYYDDTIKLRFLDSSSTIDKAKQIVEKYNRILIIMPDLKEGIESQKKDI